MHMNPTAQSKKLQPAEQTLVEKTAIEVVSANKFEGSLIKPRQTEGARGTW